MGKILEVRNLSFSYGHNKILDDVSCQIAAGECLGILGSNGCGKTTLIQCILGENVHEKDMIHLFGRAYDGTDIQIKALLGIVPDNESLLDYLTMREYLQFVGKAYRMEQKAISDAVAFWAERLHMSEYYNKLLKHFSHGMKKKVQLMGALLNRPQFLLIDEPTNGLDIEAIAELKEILKEIREEGTAILISTHILEFAEKVCSQVVFLHKQHISEKLEMEKFQGNLEQIFMEYIHGGTV